MVPRSLFFARAAVLGLPRSWRSKCSFRQPLLLYPFAVVDPLPNHLGSAYCRAYLRLCHRLRPPASTPLSSSSLPNLVLLLWAPSASATAATPKTLKTKKKTQKAEERLQESKDILAKYPDRVPIWAWDHLHIGRPEVVGAQPELVDMPLECRSKKLDPNKHTYEPRKRWTAVTYRMYRSNGSPADRDRTAQMLPGAARSCPADNITSATSQPQHHQPWNQSQIT
uniref:Uncharacterized protein n=1 Tax=Ananas comosus var. bracteatus TaxID=296719 RepID=A0A6V7QHB9_ANACO|nr:unnamed protein product [Ananas comosus var. bracteatus]